MNTTIRPSTLTAIRLAIMTDRTCRDVDAAFWRMDSRYRTDAMRRTLTTVYDADNDAKRDAMRACGVKYHGDDMYLDPENTARAGRVLSMIDRLSRRGGK